MKKLNPHSTILFLKLLRELGTRHEMHRHIRHHYPFKMERLEKVDSYGYKGTLYRLSQTYTRPTANGETRIYRYPEMTFIVIDGRTDRSRSPKRVTIYPQRYIQDSLEMDQECVVIESGVVTDFQPDWQGDQRKFADQWLKNLQEEGFIQ